MADLPRPVCFSLTPPEGKSYLVPNSYHIVRFDGPDEAFRIHLPETELNRIEPVYLSLGIDKTRNTSLDVVGDLDPNNRMAWNWEVDCPSSYKLEQSAA